MPHRNRRIARRAAQSVALLVAGLAPTGARAHGFRGGIQAQAGVGARFAAGVLEVDGAEIWANAAINGIGLEAGAFYRHQHPDRSAGARFGLGLRPLALLAGGDIETGWMILDFPVQAAAVLGGIEGASPYLGLMTEIGVEVAIPQGSDAHPAVNCRLRWMIAEHPDTEGPTVLCGLALRIAG